MKYLIVIGAALLLLASRDQSEPISEAAPGTPDYLPPEIAPSFAVNTGPGGWYSSGTSLFEQTELQQAALYRQQFLQPNINDPFPSWGGGGTTGYDLAMRLKRIRT